MKKYDVQIPLEEQFKEWLLNEGITTTQKSASSYVSRLRRLFIKVLDVFFPKKKNNRKIRLFHVIFNELHMNHMEKASELLDAMRELAFDKRWSKNRTNISENTYSDCRTALERYIEFYGQSINSCSNNANICQNEKDAIDGIINNFQKKEFTKKELYDIITFRRRTEGRYTGDIYYPIELIDTVLKKHSVNNKKYFEDWLSSMVNKIQILIDNNGLSIDFENLRENDPANDPALIIENHNVYVIYEEDKKQVYTHTDKEDEVKTMKVAIFQSIDIDHKVAISKMLNKTDYPAFAKLTDMIKKDTSFPKSGKKNQVKYLRDQFYENNKCMLEKMIGCIKKDLENLLNKVEFEMMDGHYNKKKSNN